MFLRGHVISSIYSSSKLKTKLEVISRYHEVVRSHFVKQPKQAEKSQTCTPNLFPKLVHHFIITFHIPNYLGSQQRNRLIPHLRVSSDLTGHIVSRFKLGKPKIIILCSSKKVKNKSKNRSDLEISPTNSALTSSNSRIRSKTYRLCVPNLVKKKSFLSVAISFTSLLRSRKSLAFLKDIMAKRNPTHDQKFLFYLVFFFGGST